MLKKYAEEIRNYALFFLKWLIISSFIGIICGIVGTIFFHAIKIATQIRTNYFYIIFLLPIAGLLINFIYEIQNMKKGMDTNLVIKSIREEGEIPFKLSYTIFSATFLTHLFGGSAGREGAALQIGGGIGAALGHKLKLNDREIKMITMCGMSAVFSALFGTPITATVFSIEVITVGLFHYSALFPCLIAATIANGVAIFFHAVEPAYHITQYPSINIVNIIKISLIGFLCAMLAVVFCKVMHITAKKSAQYIKNRYIRIFIGGCVIVLLTIIIGNQDYNGAGGAVIEAAIEGRTVPYAFLLKILFTAITLGFGYKGGEIVPTLFIGSTFGCFIGPYLGLPASFTAAVCMIAMFCAVVNCPMSSLMLAIELFGSENLLLFAVALAISFLLSGYTGLYTGQKIAYSKFEPTFIDRHVK